MGWAASILVTMEALPPNMDPAVHLRPPVQGFERTACNYAQMKATTIHLTPVTPSGARLIDECAIVRIEIV
jgi:hypothetical protein